MDKSLRIVFIGTPEFASVCLEKLILQGYNVVAVVTSVDKKKGRGQRVLPSDVKKCAMRNQLPVLQPSSLKDEKFLKDLRSLHIDLGIVVAFRMLPESVWKIPALGTINLHASLLPDYRGAAPINWVLINGEKKTGLTSFFLNDKIDTGDILLQEEIFIGDEINAGELHDLMAEKGALLLCETIEYIQSGNSEKIPQSTMISDQCALKVAPRIFKSDCRIPWDRSAAEVHNFIRGLSPHPAAWGTFLTKTGKEIIFKVYKSECSDLSSGGEIKKIRTDKDKFLMIGCNDFFLRIETIQVEGKKMLDIKSFLRGFDIDSVHIK